MNRVRKVLDRLARRLGYQRKVGVFKLAPGFTRCGMSRYLSSLELEKSESVATAAVDNGVGEGIVWQLWLQGERNAPAIVRKCIESVRKYTAPHRHVLLTADTLGDWIDMNPEILRKYECGKMGPALFSDYLRLCLLERYGGTWIDATVLVTGAVPVEMLESDFFVFSSPLWSGPDLERMTDMVLGPLRFFSEKPSFTMFGSSWWMRACRGNGLVATARSLLETYLLGDDTSLDYLIFYDLISLAVLRDEHCRTLWRAMPKHSTVPTQLLRSVLEEKYDSEVMKAILAMSPVHKLKYKGGCKPGSFREKLLKGVEE